MCVATYLQLELLIDLGVAIRVNAEFAEVVLKIESGVLAVIEFFESISARLIRFKHVRNVLEGLSNIEVSALRVVAPRCRIKVYLELFRDLCGDEVKRSSRCSRSVLNLARAFGNFHGGHPSKCRKVVGGRRRVWGRSRQDSILHERYRSASLRGGAAHSDIRSKTKGVLFYDVYSGNLTKGSGDIAHAGLCFLHGLSVKHSGCAGNRADVARVSDHRDSVEDLVALGRLGSRGAGCNLLRVNQKGGAPYG